MFNILERFKPQMIEGFRKMKHRYLVSQTYREGYDHFNDNPKDCLLFSDYEDLGMANVHFRAVKNDKYAALLDLEREDHRNKIYQLLQPESRFDVYCAFINNAKQVKARADVKFDGNIRRYISKNTTWRIGSDKTIKPQLQLIFGEIFVVIRYGGQQLRIKLADLERT